MKRALRILIFFLIIALVVAANISRRNSKIVGIAVRIDYPTNDTLINAEQVEQLILQQLPHVTSQLVKEVDTKAINKVVSTCPYLQDNEVSVSLGRNIVVKAQQRRPIVHLFYGKEEFYLDRYGRCVPTSELGDVNVIMANGVFQQQLSDNYVEMDLERYSKDSAKCHYGIVRVWQMACYLDQHDKLRDQYDQIYLAPNGDLILVPVLGDFTIVIGDPVDLDTKFKNLQRLTEKVFPKVGWDFYSQINLKYHNQVVCTKSPNKPDQQ